jgi:hypothetical protein
MVDPAHQQRPPVPGDVPNEEEAEREFGTTHDGRPLKEQRDLVDENGTDIRQYTGEPVPTEDGFVIPAQQVVGSERVVGGGEWPDEPPRGDEDDERD